MALSSSAVAITAPAMARGGGLCVGSIELGVGAGGFSRQMGLDRNRCVLPRARGREWWSSCASLRGQQGWRVLRVQELAQHMGLTNSGEILAGGRRFQNGQHRPAKRPSRQPSMAHVRATSDSVNENNPEPKFQSSVAESEDEAIMEGIGRRHFVTVCSIIGGFVAVNILGEDARVHAVETPPKAKAKVKGRAPSSPYDEDRLLEQNRRMQKLNNAPAEFPGFVREGFQVKVITSEKYVTSNTGLMYYDMKVGEGEAPHDGQQVIFHYTGYNESGRRVDSSYQQGRPARTRLGIQGMIPGFEEGIKSMKAGGRRIIIVPPELGPPVGPSTFFSAKQFEVFDVELLETKECNRRTLLFYSDVVCG